MGQRVFLTAGADVQKDRLELEIVAWGRDRECWSVDYRVLQGDPAKADVWIALDAVLAESFTHETGVNLAIIKLAIDTGYARAAAASVGIDRFNENVWLRLETALGLVTEVNNPAPEVTTAPPQSPPAPQRRTIRSSYL